MTPSPPQTHTHIVVKIMGFCGLEDCRHWKCFNSTKILVRNHRYHTKCVSGHLDQKIIKKDNGLRRRKKNYFAFGTKKDPKYVIFWDISDCKWDKTCFPPFFCAFLLVLLLKLMYESVFWTSPSFCRADWDVSIYYWKTEM